jgi:hypothetical protein
VPRRWQVQQPRSEPPRSVLAVPLRRKRRSPSRATDHNEPPPRRAPRRLRLAAKEHKACGPDERQPNRRPAPRPSLPLPYRTPQTHTKR